MVEALESWLPSIGVSAFDFLEIGSSAGMNLNFDCIRLHAPPSGLPSAPVACVERRGSDPHMLDVAREDHAQRLLSFVWSDQLDRFQRLRRAIDVARTHPARVDRTSADDFVRDRLAPTAERAERK